MKKYKLKKSLSNKRYHESLKFLQIELVKLQRHIIKNNLQILIIFEGRDAAGKDGAIKRIIEHLSPRETRVVALGKPSDHDSRSWYFQRYSTHLPSKQEMVLMNRSWYNRAGVERVMGYCTKKEYEAFMEIVPSFENILSKAGIQIFKYYLDISKDEQRKRLKDRKRSPLKQWKVSPIDEAAQKHWKDYSKARNEMLIRTHTDFSPWYIVRANNKKETRLNIIRHLMAQVDCPNKNEHLLKFNPDIIFKFKKNHLTDGAIAL